MYLLKKKKHHAGKKSLSSILVFKVEYYDIKLEMLIGQEIILKHIFLEASLRWQGVIWLLYFIFPHLAWFLDQSLINVKSSGAHGMMMVDSIILTDQLNIGNNKNQVIFINYCRTHKI